MRLITHESLIKRNSFIGRTASLAGLVILLAGLIISILAPPGSQPKTSFAPLAALVSRPEFQYLPLITLLVGFLLSQVGILFSNRWVRPPRPDEALDAALKGLDDRHVLYHYRLHASHVLVAPSGVYVLLPKRQGGEITYANSRWRQKGHNRFLAFFAQEGLGNPTAELEVEVKLLEGFLEKKLPDAKIEVKGIIVFTDIGATVQADAAPAPVLHTKKVKEYIRRQPKAPTLTPAMMAQLNEAIGVAGPA